MTGIGIDVSKDSLAVAVARVDWTGEFPNSSAGHKQLVRALKRRSQGPRRVVIEPTATYHLAIATLLANTAYFEVMIANPRTTANFAKALNQRGKTDAADCGMLAKYASTMPFVRWNPPSAAAVGLRSLVRRRLQLVRQRTMEKTRLKEAVATGGDDIVIEDIEATLDFLDSRVAAMEKRAVELVRANQELEEWRRRLCTIPGVADITALSVIAELVCLPSDIGAKQLTAMAGLDPQPRQSGMRDAARHISKKGNKRLRTALYLAAWNAASFSPHVKAWKNQLIERGKAPNVAYVATARRLLVAMHHMTRTNSDWDGESFHASVP